VKVLQEAATATSEGDGLKARGGAVSLKNIDFGLLIYFALWYLGNYYVSFTNVMVSI
jgi:hypothetical protein